MTPTYTSRLSSTGRRSLSLNRPNISVHGYRDCGVLDEIIDRRRTPLRDHLDDFRHYYYSTPTSKNRRCQSRSPDRSSFLSSQKNHSLDGSSSSSGYATPEASVENGDVLTPRPSIGRYSKRVRFDDSSPEMMTSSTDDSSYVSRDSLDSWRAGKYEKSSTKNPTESPSKWRLRKGLPGISLKPLFGERITCGSDEVCDRQACELFIIEHTGSTSLIDSIDQKMTSLPNDLLSNDQSFRIEQIDDVSEADQTHSNHSSDEVDISVEKASDRFDLEDSSYGSSPYFSCDEEFADSESYKIFESNDSSNPESCKSYGFNGNDKDISPTEETFELFKDTITNETLEAKSLADDLNMTDIDREIVDGASKSSEDQNSFLNNGRIRGNENLLNSGRSECQNSEWSGDGMVIVTYEDEFDQTFVEVLPRIDNDQSEKRRFEKVKYNHSIFKDFFQKAFSNNI